jgi:hypothetical protein
VHALVGVEAPAPLWMPTMNRAKGTVLQAPADGLAPGRGPLQEEGVDGRLHSLWHWRHLGRLGIIDRPPLAGPADEGLVVATKEVPGVRGEGPQRVHDLSGASALVNSLNAEATNRTLQMQVRC